MELSCHCGKIKLVVSRKPDTLTSCNCSICRRYVALWGYYLPDEVTIVADSENIQSYKWSDEYLAFNHCKHCGCMTHYVTTEKIKKPKIALNFRMADPKEIEGIAIRRFDGADTWKYLD